MRQNDVVHLTPMQSVASSVMDYGADVERRNVWECHKTIVAVDIVRNTNDMHNSQFWWWFNSHHKLNNIII